jgi:aminoglycoside phosphotransferase (APT) family kinase protein
MDRSSFLHALHAQFGVPDHAVASFVERVTNGSVVAVERLVDGDEYEVHRVDLAGARTVYVRICLPDTPTGKPHREARAMELARLAGVPVPEVLAVEPIAADDGEREAMVVAAATGSQLSDLLPSLSFDQRRAVMMDLGRVLTVLHSVPLPELRKSDAERRRYIANVIADCDHLDAAGLTGEEIDQIRALLSTFVDIPAPEVPVLCHGDLSHRHVCVDSGLRVCGLIDWGLWSAGAAVDDLADFTHRNVQVDVAAVLVGHYGSAASDPALMRAIARSTMTQVIGYLRWMIASEQLERLEPGVTALRRALAILRETG